MFVLSLSLRHGTKGFSLIKFALMTSLWLVLDVVSQARKGSYGEERWRRAEKLQSRQLNGFAAAKAFSVVLLPLLPSMKLSNFFDAAVSFFIFFFFVFSISVWGFNLLLFVL